MANNRELWRWEVEAAAAASKALTAAGAILDAFNRDEAVNVDLPTRIDLYAEGEVCGVMFRDDTDEWGYEPK